MRSGSNRPSYFNWLFPNDVAVDSEPRTSLTSVDAFERSVYFLTKDSHLNVLDASVAGDPQPVFGIPGTIQFNSQIAVSHDLSAAFVSDGRAIYRVEINGTAEKIISLSEIDTFTVDAMSDRLKVNWFFFTPDSGRIFYFTLLPMQGSKSPTTHVCRLDVEQRELNTIELSFWPGIDVDPHNDTVYALNVDRRCEVIARNFSGSINRSYSVSCPYTHCQLSPDRSVLLLSCSMIERNSAIATLNVSNGNESILPFDGAYAAWGSDGSILFVRGENSLWIWRPGEEPERLIIIGPEEHLFGNGISYAKPPVLTRDGSLVSWQWHVGPWKQSTFGSMLIDLERRQYRALDGWWHNVAWINPDADLTR